MYNADPEINSGMIATNFNSTFIKRTRLETNHTEESRNHLNLFLSISSVASNPVLNGLFLFIKNPGKVQGNKCRLI